MLQPDYEGGGVMEESKFRQQLEQRNKNHQKKHGKYFHFEKFKKFFKGKPFKGSDLEILNYLFS